MDGTAQEAREKEQYFIGKPPAEVAKDGNKFEENQEIVAALFDSHVSNLCSERETIWQRYNVMVGVHTFLLGAVGALIATDKVTFDEVKYIIMFSELLCVVWLGMTMTTWRAYRLWEELASRFPLPFVKGISDSSKAYSHVNPYVVRKNWRDDLYKKNFRKLYYVPICKWFRFESLTYFFACFMIILFMFGYGALLLHHRNSHKAGTKLPPPAPYTLMVRNTTMN